MPNVRLPFSERDLGFGCLSLPPGHFASSFTVPLWPSYVFTLGVVVRTNP